MFHHTINRYRNILHIRFQAAFYDLPAQTLIKISPDGFFNRLLKIILYTGGRLFKNLFSITRTNRDLGNKVWLYVVSQNNYDALSFLKERLPETTFVAGQNKQIGRYNNQVNRLSLRWKLFYTLSYFIPVLIGLYKINGKKAIRFFDLIFISIGYYEQYLKHLQKFKPKAIILANDHNDDARAMLLAAKACKIQVIYIQHASVSTAFPPLEFDLSLLEGQDAFDKYKLCGPVTGEVKLIGMPKADKFINCRNFKKTVETIGVSGNLIDDYTILKETFLNLVKSFQQNKFIFRPHPADLRDYQFVKALGPTVFYSNPKTETAFEFLQKIDLLIAADSSIHLETALLNIPSLYYRFGESNFQHDYYGYVAKGLVPEAKSDIELKRQIEQIQLNKPDVYQKTVYYNAVIGTVKEGKSTDLAVSEIMLLLAKKTWT